MKKLFLPISLVAMILTLVFSEVRNQDFVRLDDDRNIYSNPYFNPVTVSNIAYFWKHPYTDTYRPMVFTSWAIISIFARGDTHQPVLGTGQSTNLNPGVFHIANLVLHIMNTMMVLAILYLLIRTQWAAFGGAIFFGIHPVQVESVAWVTGFNELLYAFFSLLCIYTYLRYTLITPWEKVTKLNFHYCASTLFFALALLVKPTAVALPLIAWVLAYWMLKRPARRCISDLIPWIFLCIPWIFLTHLFESAKNQSVPTSLLARPFIIGDTLAFYFVKLVAPLQLGIDYGRSPQWVLQQIWTYLIWLIPCAILIAAWRKRKHMPWFASAVGIFVAALSPVLGLVSFVFQGWSTVADRYMYLALLGPALACAVMLRHSQNRSINAAFCLVVLLMGIKSTFQTLTWYNSYTLYLNAIEVNPRSTSSLGNLGMILLNGGQYEEAANRYRQLLHLQPDLPAAHLNLGIALFKQGLYEEAANQYRELVRLQPDSPEAHTNLGIVFFKQGKISQAIEEYQQALRLQPAYKPAQMGLKEAIP